MWIQFANLIQTGLLLEHKAPFACEIHSLGTVFIEARDLNIQECVDIIPVSMYPRLSEVLRCPPANPSAVDHRLPSSQARVVFFLTLICVCACVCACTRMWYGSQGTARGDQLSLSFDYAYSKEWTWVIRFGVKCLSTELSCRPEKSLHEMISHWPWLRSCKLVPTE